MKQKNGLILGLLIGFAVIQLTLTILIFIADKNSLFDTTLVKYSGIILCFILACFAFKKKRSYFLIAGLAGTLIADYFLLVRSDNYLVGVCAFIVVQAMYFLYIMPKHWKISLIIRGSVFIVGSLVAGLALQVNDVTAYFALFYFSNLIMNMVDSWISGKRYLLFSIGLVLFIGCDVSVGFNNLSSYISYSSQFIDKLVDFSQLAMWAFYLPSQALLALSPYFKERYEQKD